MQSKDTLQRLVSFARVPSIAICQRGENHDDDDDNDPEAEDAHGERGVLRVGGRDVDAEAAGAREQRGVVAHEGRVVQRVGCECRARGAKSLARSAAEKKSKRDNKRDSGKGKNKTNSRHARRRTKVAEELLRTQSPQRWAQWNARSWSAQPASSCARAT